MFTRLILIALVLLASTASAGGWISGGSGLLETAITHPLSWPMGTGGTAGSTYTGGFYIFGASANDFAPAVNLGTANGSYAAHAFVVAAAGAVDTEVTVSGTSITDAGVRTTTGTNVLDYGSIQIWYRDN